MLLKVRANTIGKRDDYMTKLHINWLLSDLQDTKANEKE